VKALRLLDGGFPIPSTKNLTHVVHVSDAVQAFAKALDRGSGTCNIADREPVRFVGFAESILSELGRQPKKMPPWLLSLLVGFTSMKTYYKTLVANRNYDISRARRQLLFSPKAGMAEGIRDMVEWYREEFGGSATAER
jgi:nucleoside-diphosphate-sugar epimerase